MSKGYVFKNWETFGDSYKNTQELAKESLQALKTQGVKEDDIRYKMVSKILDHFIEVEHGGACDPQEILPVAIREKLTNGRHSFLRKKIDRDRKVKIEGGIRVETLMGDPLTPDEEELEKLDDELNDTALELYKTILLDAIYCLIYDDSKE